LAGPFDGITILELATGIAGPYAAMLLADQGADVIKIEPPDGDPARFLPGFRVWNRGKRSVLTDIESPEGREAVRRLAGGVDVLVADFPPGRTERLGLDYDSLAKDNPGLVYCYLPPFGEAGPHAHREADDALVAAVGGVAGGQPSAAGNPVFVVIPVSSYGAALLAAGAISVALRAREATGRGQKAIVSWLAGALAMATGSLVGVEGGFLSPLGLVSLARQPQGASPVYRLYRAADDWLFIACGNSTFWGKLCIALDVPELVSDPRFENAPWGITNFQDRAALYEIIAPVIASKPRAHWLQLFEEFDVPAAPVQGRAEFINDPQVVHNGMRVELDDPEVGRTVQMGIPITLKRTPGAIRGPAPILGEHTREVLGSPPRTSSPKPAPSSRTYALEGVRVVDLTNYIAGSLCGMLLADYGADVVKVESLEGDSFRTFGLGFMGWNRGKRSVALDLKREEGRRILRELAARADVVVENFRYGVAERLGADYEALAPRNPRLVYCTIAGFGVDGPYAEKPAFDPLFQARSGAMAAQGGPGQPPVFLSAAITDYSAALLATYGITAALFERERSGQGQRVVTSLTNATIAGQSGSFVFYDGASPEQQGGADFLGPSAVVRSYQAGDGWLFLACRREGHWAALARALGRPELAQRHSWEAAAAAPADGALGDTLASIFRQDPLATWLARLDGAGVPCAPIPGLAQLLRDEHLEANALMTDHDHPQWGRIRQTGLLVKLSGTPGCIQRRAPILGEHAQEVLAELGRTEEEIARLRETGIIA
jgi:crotonobetainyl-CoA:carnitine CoA-transferase CaiB-like acyl-CoA transferase